jgi:NNP family nitrate/nitrite transporter-like MFS transporter
MTAPMTTTDSPVATRRTGRWLDHWEPEDPDFWESTGKAVAKRNLIFSILAEHLGFSVWLIWSVSAALLAKGGFLFTPAQLFYLVAVPNLVGSLLRLPYTFAVTKFGGRNWTVVSALLLVIPTMLFAYFVQRPETPYWVFIVIAATAGVGGGNFSSSMTNINFFYPSRLKGSALGLNAAGGNLGVAVIQFFLPIIVGVGGAFGLIKAATVLKDGKVLPDVHLEYGGYIGALLAIIAAVCAYFFMNNITKAVQKPGEVLAVAKYKHTWIMALLYIGTFGSFIGYSAAMPLLIKINFFRAPIPTEQIGINFAFYAFLGALVGSIARPFGGWLADKIGGAKVTAGCFVGMIAGTLGIYTTLNNMRPVPPPDPEKLKIWAADPTKFPGWDANPLLQQVHANVLWNADHIFPIFLAIFLFVFAMTGIANGSTYKTIPHIWKANAEHGTETGTVERYAAETKAAKEGSSVLGLVGAVGALGGFLIPITFGAPWVTDPVSAVKNAFLIFSAFYVVCFAVNFVVYVRKSSFMGSHNV